MADQGNRCGAPTVCMCVYVCVGVVLPIRARVLGMSDRHVPCARKDTQTERKRGSFHVASGEDDAKKRKKS